MSGSYAHRHRDCQGSQHPSSATDSAYRGRAFTGRGNSALLAGADIPSVHDLSEEDVYDFSVHDPQSDSAAVTTSESETAPSPQSDAAPQGSSDWDREIDDSGWSEVGNMTYWDVEIHKSMIEPFFCLASGPLGWLLGGAQEILGLSKIPVQIRVGVQFVERDAYAWVDGEWVETTEVAMGRAETLVATGRGIDASVEAEINVEYGRDGEIVSRLGVQFSMASNASSSEASAGMGLDAKSKLDGAEGGGKISVGGKLGVNQSGATADGRLGVITIDDLLQTTVAFDPLDILGLEGGALNEASVWPTMTKWWHESDNRIPRDV